MDSFKSTTKRGCRKRLRKEIKGDWPDAKVFKLISIVELRPELWENGGINYRIPKPKAWQEVAAEFGDNEDWQECRAKWQNLRVSYKCNLAKSLKKGSSHGSDDSGRIRWRFFESMSFIGKNDSHSNKSSSNLNFNNVSISAPESETVESCSSQPSQEITPASPVETKYVGRRPKWSSSYNRVDTPPLVNKTIRTFPEQGLNLMRHDDEHSAFGDYIAAELRRLPVPGSIELKRRLTRTLLGYWDDIQLQLPSTNSVVNESDSFTTTSFVINKVENENSTDDELTNT